MYCIVVEKGTINESNFEKKVSLAALAENLPIFVSFCIKLVRLLKKQKCFIVIIIILR